MTFVVVVYARSSLYLQLTLFQTLIKDERCTALCRFGDRPRRPLQLPVKPQNGSARRTLTISPMARGGGRWAANLIVKAQSRNI